MAMPGWPADFQPQCVTNIEFNVHAKTIEGEDIVILGNTVTLGDGDPEKAVSLDGDDAPAWTITIEQPANTEIIYEYVRYEPDGAYIYEDSNRTFTTGGCGSSHTLTDKITTNTPPQSKNRRSMSMAAFSSMSSKTEKRQASGSGKGLPNCNLIDPPYTITNAAGSLSNKTLDTDLVHYNGLVEYDTHNLYLCSCECSLQQPLLCTYLADPLNLTSQITRQQPRIECLTTSLHYRTTLSGKRTHSSLHTLLLLCT